MSKILIANDHGGTERKNEIVGYLTEWGYEVEDLGIGEGEAVDYPDKAAEACRRFQEGGFDLGILCCGTGIGISMAANKFPGIRCALPQNNFAAKMSREHNNANFLAFGGRIEYKDSVKDMLKTFLESQFEGGRHQRRVDKIHQLEK